MTTSYESVLRWMANHCQGILLTVDWSRSFSSNTLGSISPITWSASGTGEPSPKMSFKNAHAHMHRHPIWIYQFMYASICMCEKCVCAHVVIWYNILCMYNCICISKYGWETILPWSALLKWGEPLHSLRVCQTPGNFLYTIPLLITHMLKQMQICIYIHKYI